MSWSSLTVEPRLADLAHHLRRDAVNAECDQLVAVVGRQACGADLADELRCDAVNAKRDEHVGVEA